MTRAERDAEILRLAGEGIGCREIGRRLDVSRQLVSMICKKAGHVFGAKNIERAVEANRAYGAERRSGQELELADKLDVIITRYTAKTRVHSFGGRDNTFCEKLLDKPDSKTLLELARAANATATTMKLLHNYEGQQGDDLTAVDAFLAEMKGAS